MDKKRYELIRESLVSAGVKNLREYGYPGVTKENILTDIFYSQFFLGMLDADENKTGRADIDAVIAELRAEIGNKANVNAKPTV